MTFHAAKCASILALGFSIAACGGSTSDQVATWRADCPSLARPAPLSLDAAREAARLAERRDGEPGVADLVFHDRGHRIVDYRRAWAKACKARGVRGIEY